MTPFTALTAPAAVLARDNIDTDQIIPARFLRKPRGEGYDGFLFHDLRATDPAFALDQPEAAGAAILIAGKNFGCGSSREGAVYALMDAGIRCVIAPSFGDIFAGNAAKNGLLTVAMPADRILALIAGTNGAVTLTVDLPAQSVRGPDGMQAAFEIDSFVKTCLVQGLDQIGLTLSHADEIASFEAADRASRPWVTPNVA